MVFHFSICIDISCMIVFSRQGWCYGGGGLALTWYTYMCLPFGALFHEIWYSDRGGGVSSEAEESKLHKLGYFGQIIVKTTQFGQNWVLFFQKWYRAYWWVGNWTKNWYRESQSFKVLQAHSRTILVRVSPRGCDDVTKIGQLPWKHREGKRGEKTVEAWLHDYAMIFVNKK